MKSIVKVIAGIAAIVFAFWGLNLMSDALFVPYTTLLQGGTGLAFLFAALAIGVWFIAV